MITESKKETPGRRVSTRKQKENAVEYVKLACERKIPITDSSVKKKMYVGHVVSRLLEIGAIAANGLPDVYVWKSSDLTSAELVEMCWTQHGTEEDPVEKRSSTLADRILVALNMIERYNIGITNEDKARYIADFVIASQPNRGV